jgi:anaerobic magnesium-protoporphyrin IX monomethyl ester cyclase
MEKFIIFVNPYFGSGDSKLNKQTGTYAPPLGLGFLATFIRDKLPEYRVKVIDPIPQRISRSSILKLATSATHVALSCFSDIRFDCFDLARDIKQANPGITVIIGGAHTYFLDREILSHYPFIDIIVRGEGEFTLREILSGNELSGILGITWRSTAGIIQNKPRPFSENIDDFYIDFNLLPDMSCYPPDVEAPKEFHSLRNAYIIESRGCPFQCIYCANEHWNRHWRAVSPEKTVQRMEKLKNEFGIEYFRFYDDLFTADKKRVLDFCRLLREKQLNIKFRVLVRAGTDRETLEALKSVGCVSVGFGIESGSDRMLVRINKKITRKQIMDTAKICADLGLWTVGAFIVSLPDETMEDYYSSLELVSIVDTFQAGILILFPGTPFYRELKERGEIDDSIWFDRRLDGRISYCKENFPSASFSMKQLRWMVIRFQYRSFLMNPGRLFRQYSLSGALARLFLAIADSLFRGRLYWLFVKTRAVVNLVSRKISKPR